MKFKLLVCMTAGVMLFTECKKSSSVHDGILTINDANNCQEVAFEDVATNIRIVPLISDEPLGCSTQIKCYGSTALIVSSDLYTLYFFEDGKLTAKLSKPGRGRGEYNFISDFVYSPERKIVYVLNSSRILKYSVPEMEYLGMIEHPNMIKFAEHDDSTLICYMTSPEEKPGIYFINTENGQVSGKLKDVSGLSFLMSTEMSYYTPDHRILAQTSCINTVSEVSADTDKGEEIILTFDFGKDGMPAKFDSIDENVDMDFMMELGQYLNDHRETIVTEVSKLMADDQSISFWYHSGLVGYNHYCRITDGQVVTYKGFQASGTKGFILPSGLTDGGQYVTLIDQLPETVFEGSQERSAFSSQLEETMKAQAFNNPVLRYYNIK